MSIGFACPKCKKKYKVKDSLAGKSAKCAKCNHRMKIPQPVVAEPVALPSLAAGDGLGDWFDDELSKNNPSTGNAGLSTDSLDSFASDDMLSAKKSTQKKSSPKNCSACSTPLADGAVICIACGYDLRSGKKHETTRVVEKAESRGKATVKQTASLARGALFSAIGALLGAGVWVAAVLVTDYEIGWIAIGLGFATGAGMAMGHEDDDGTLAGIIAGGISILGIVCAKFLVFQHLKSQLVDLGFSEDMLNGLLGEEFTFWSLFGPIDGLFILLAVTTAYRIGSGQATD